MHPFNFSCIPIMLKRRRQNNAIVLNNYELRESRKWQPNFQLKTAEFALIALLDGRTDCCYSDEHLSSHKLLFQCYILLQSYIQH